MNYYKRYLKGLQKEVILGPLFKLFEAVMELFVPLVMADIIDKGISTADTTYILQRGALLLLLAALSVVFGLTCQYFAARAASVFGRRLRNSLFKQVMHFSANEINQFGAGSLITHLTNDVNQIQTGLNMAIRLASRVPFLLFGSIIMAFTINAKISILFLLSTPVIIAILYYITKITLPGYGKIQKGQDALSRLGRENLAGMRVIRAFSGQQKEVAQFDEQSSQLSNLIVRVGTLSAALNPLTTLVINLAIIAIVWFGASAANTGAILSGSIIALISYMNQTLLALLVAANLVVLFTRALASMKRVQVVMETQPSVKDGPGATAASTDASVAFNHVSFAYHTGSANALDNITFTLPKGETLGIIGGTGSGKSTVANLILRYYDIQGGEIQYFGHNVTAYTLQQLRQGIGFVPQGAALLNGSIRYNLQVAAPNASDETLWHALEVAQAADFVRALPQQLDTVINEGGKNLSGGQRQRLTIARALAKQPALLILDDAASALDYATDAALRKALHQETQRTGDTMATIIISQRAASIKHANQIIVLDDGAMVGIGTHDELLQTSKIYWEICQSQGLVTAEGGDVQ